MNFFNLLVFLQKGDKGDFEVPVDSQKSFISSFREPNDDIERGYYQYLCQNVFVPSWKQVCLNVIAALGLIIVIIYYVVKRLFVTKGDVIPVMIENKGMDEVVPEIVKQQYRPSTVGYNEGASLSLSDICFLFKLVNKSPLHPYFVFKAMMNIARYSGMIKKHSPGVMIQFGEFSFSSSILTAFCHLHRIKHIDVMHGEKIFCIKDSFFHYDECYVWSDYYINLFKSQRAYPDQFIVALPPSMVIDIPKFFNKNSFADYKYYLELYNEREIKQIVSSMEFALKGGMTVKYRPHPRYSDVSLLRKYVKDEDIELPREVSILESISSTNNAVGLYTTVMAQAYYSGKNVIIDDMTFKDIYDKCEEYQYAMVKLIPDKLSMHQ